MPNPQNPAETLLQLASGLWTSRAVWAAAREKIADAVPEDGVAIKDLAAQKGLLPDRLKRLLRTLSSVGVFAVGDDDIVRHTDASLLLRSGEAGSLRAFVESVFGGEHYAAFGVIDEILREPISGFEKACGAPAFDYYAAHPEAGALFAQAMSDFTGPIDAAVSAYDFPPFETAVDVGGSLGSLARKVIAQRPGARAIVFDLPDTAARAENAWRGAADADRLTAVGGDFFKAVPDGGDLYLLKFILHDWNDDQCVQILNNIRSAMKPDATLCILELVLPDDGSPHPGWFMDLNMMANTDGRERTLSEYDGLLGEAGFKRRKATAMPPNLTLVEAGRG